MKRVGWLKITEAEVSFLYLSRLIGAGKVRSRDINWELSSKSDGVYIRLKRKS